jgi:hypothetical protein
MSYKVSELIFTADQDGLLSALAEPREVGDLMKATGWRREALLTALDVLVATGFAESKDGCFFLAREARRFLPLVALEGRMRTWHAERGSLRRSLTEGERHDPLDGWKGEELFAEFAVAMAATSRETALRLRRLLPAGGLRRVVDLGGADGAVAAHLAPFFPGTTFCVVDRAGFAASFAVRMAASDAASRIVFQASDLRSHEAVTQRVRGADAVLLLNTGHLLEEAVLTSLLRAVVRSAASGATFIVRDMFRREGAQTALDLSGLIDWLKCGSCFRSSLSEMVDLLVDVGFVHVATHSLAAAPDSFIVVRTP